jgi:hypothetical protein
MDHQTSAVASQNIRRKLTVLAKNLLSSLRATPIDAWRWANKQIRGLNQQVSAWTKIPLNWIENLELVAFAELGDRMLTLELYGVTIVIWSLVAVAIAVKLWRCVRGVIARAIAALMLILIYAVAISAVNVKRVAHPWWFPIKPYVSVQVASEIVADVHTRAMWHPPKNGGRETGVYKPVFQDLFHEWTITLTPNRDTARIVVSIRDARQPTDRIRVQPPSAVISEPRPGWVSGFDEPTQVPDFYTRTVTFESISATAIIEIRKPIKSHFGENRIDAIDLDLDRKIGATIERGQIEVIPITSDNYPLSSSNPHFGGLIQELKVLIAQKVTNGPAITRPDPDEPYPALSIDESENVQELRCKNPTCSELTVEMKEKTRIR